jgi:aminoglycoside phosphotransferase (APT) family kinase protein
MSEMLTPGAGLPTASRRAYASAGTGELPGPLAELARRAAGEIVAVVDRSWPRDNSAVWEVRSGCGSSWFVKQHPSQRLHGREVSAYRHWTAALGIARAPALAAVDSRMLAIVVTGLPGQVVRDLRLGAGDEREAHRQAGVLLRRLHEIAVARAGHESIDRIAGRVDEHLRGAAGLLAPAETALVRRCAAELAAIAPQLPAVPTHGDVQPRNMLWDPATRQLALIDFERAELAPAIRDLVRLEYGPWDQRPDLRDAFISGYGRNLTSAERHALRCMAALDALSGLQWGTANADAEVTSRSRRALERLLGMPGVTG